MDIGLYISNINKEAPCAMTPYNSWTTQARLDSVANKAMLADSDPRAELFPDLVTPDSVPKWRASEVGERTFTREQPCGTCGGQIYVLYRNNTDPTRDRIMCHNCKLEEPKRNVAATRARKAKYRANKKHAVPEDLSEADRQMIEDLHAESVRLSKETGVAHHVDHIIPLSKGGLHHPRNMRVCTALENVQKGNKMPAEWHRVRNGYNMAEPLSDNTDCKLDVTIDDNVAEFWINYYRSLLLNTELSTDERLDLVDADLIRRGILRDNSTLWFESPEARAWFVLEFS